ncbi:carbon storage regulator [Pseudomonas sp. QL9]|uniref:carbon storage regulator n=1 Tax=Pseudomonas sp. QL9 TaxID=3242725 RepID=UPI00352B74C1
MLSLTRCAGQSIQIGDNTRVKVLRIEGGTVVLGIQASDDVAVHRLELYRRLKEPVPSVTVVDPTGKPSLRSSLARFFRPRKTASQ